MEALNKPWIFPLVFFHKKHTINSVVTMLMIAKTHTTTGITTVRYGSDKLVGNSVVGITVTADVMMGLIKGQLLPTQTIPIHTNNNDIYSVLYCARYVTYK